MSGIQIQNLVSDDSEKYLNLDTKYPSHGHCALIQGKVQFPVNEGKAGIYTKIDKKTIFAPVNSETETIFG